MIYSMTCSDMEALLKREYPHRAPESLEAMAATLLTQLDDQLDASVRAYWTDGTETDFYSGEFSIFEIRRLRHCGYLDALILMDGYLKDARVGRMRIMRR